MPPTIVQLSDLHMTVGDPQPEEALAAAVAHVQRLRPQPLAVIVTGDIADTGHPDEYAAAQRLLAPLTPPLFVLAGNHDDATELRRVFGGAATGSVIVGPMRVVWSDTNIPQRPEGRYDVTAIARVLAEDPVTPTILALHHPPLRTGVRAMDALGVAPEDEAALAEVVRASRNVVRIIAGHVHRAAVGALGGVPVYTSPSTCVELVLDLEGDTLAVNLAEPTGFTIHVLTGDGELVSHVQPVLPS